MKVTVCQLHDHGEQLAADWHNLVEHVGQNASELVVLPEMGLSKWLAATDKFDQAQWLAGIAEHERWIDRFEHLAPAAVLGSRPTIVSDKNHNQGFLWDVENGLQTVHTKYYLPDEAEFWEATWYKRSLQKRFAPFPVKEVTCGMMLCTDMWFTEHARGYARAGADLLLCPRATPTSTVDKWIAGGRVAAVMSGAFCLSSNHAGHYPNVHMGGVGWVIDPEGDVVGLTSDESPFLTLDIDVLRAKRAKQGYPRYVLE
ncbi:MAG: carbon-nitrogen hydrolase family protein [Acidiferrobacterales bacterium]